jgi:hypothetical protein
MLVRIRLPQGPALQKKRGKNRHLALAFSALLGPAALMAFVLGAWALAAELRWIREFAIRSGPFAQWEIWMTLGAGLVVLASALNRYGN